LQVNTEPKLSRLVELIVAQELEPRVGRSGDVPALALQVQYTVSGLPTQTEKTPLKTPDFSQKIP
jgi:hypothetical protein